LAVLTINKLFGGGGDPTKGPVNPTAPQVDADPTSRQLLVRGSASQIEQIRTLLEKLGETGAADASVAEAANNAKVRTIPLRGRTAQSAIEAIQDIWPTLRSNRIRVVTPAATIPSVRPSAAGDERDLRTPPAPAKEPADAPAGKPATKAGGAVTPLPADPQYDKSPAEKTTQFEPRWSEVPVVFVADGLPVVPPPLVPKTTKAIEVEPAADGAATAPAAAPAVPVPTPPVAVPAAPTVSPAPPSQVPPVPAPVPRPAPGPAATPRKLADGKELPPIMVAPGPGGVVIACDDVEALNEFEELLNTLASGATSNVPEMTIFYLKHAKAASVAETLEQVLSGGTSGESSGGGGGGNLLTDIAGAAIGDRGGILGTLLGMGESGTIKPTGQLKITPDTRLNALVVQANAADTEMIEQLLKILDQKESPEDVLIVPKSKMIALKNTQAQEIAEIVRQVYQDRVVAGGAGGQQRPPSPQEFIQMLRGGRRGGGGGGRDRGGSADEPQKMSLSIDARTNSVILLAPEPLFSEVQQLIEQLDRAAVDSSQTMRVVTLQKASPDTVQQALMAIVGDGIQLGPGAQAAMRGSSRRSAMAQMQRMPGMQGGYTGQRTGGFQPGGMQPGGFQPGGFQPGGMQPGGFQQPFGGRSFGGQNFGGGQPGGFAPMNTGTRSFNTGNRGLTTGRGLSPGRSNTGRSNAGRGGRGG
jgi:type II secretory pathway component GspD/PulD (secretin)